MEKKIVIQATGISLTKGVFGALPYVGTLLNEAVFDNRARIKQERINHFIKELQDYLSREVKQDEVNFNYIKSEEFGDLFESIIVKISQNRSEEKVHRFKRVLVNQMTTPYETEYIETFLEIVSKINEKQIEILNTYRKAYYGEIKHDNEPADRKILNDNPIAGAMDFRHHNYYKLERHIYKFYVQDLVSKSLLLDDSMNRYDTSPYDLLEITEFGIEFLRFIESSNF